MQVAVIVNPVRQQSRDAATHVVQECRTRGLAEPMVLETSVADPGAGQARHAVAASATRLVVCGGDGTVRAVAPCVASPEGVSLGVVATGTANLFARNAGLPLARVSPLGRAAALAAHRLSPARSPLAAAVGTALGQQVRHADLGRAQLSRGDRTETHDFLVVAGIGHDAATVAATRPALKRHLSWGAYFQPAISRLLRGGHDMLLSVDEQPAEATRAWTVLAGIGGRIPLGVNIFPGAAIDDGLLDVAVVSPRTPAHWLPIAGRVLLRRSGEGGSLRHLTAHSVQVVPARPQPVQLDGDAYPAVESLRVSLAVRAVAVAVG